MVSSARQTGRVLMEALHHRYHPLMQRVRELVPALGPLLQIEAKFCFLLPGLNDIRLDFSLGGGATMDVGPYTLDLILQVAAASGDPALAGMPRVVRATAKLLKPNVDRFMKAELLWENGTSGLITNSILSARTPGIQLKATGERGQLHVSNPVTPHRGHQLDVTIGGKSHREKIAGKSSYHYQLLEFERRVREQIHSPDLETSVANMELIDAIYTAAGLPLRGLH
jgi:predicted dehydrogenase